MIDATNASYYGALINERGGLLRFDGGLYHVEGVATPTEADVLTHAKTRAKRRIDAAAEAERQNYVTPGDGQQMVYMEKAAQALAVENDPAPDPADYPILAASIGVDGADVAEVGATVRATRAAWMAIAASIETKRAAAKAAIDAAATFAELAAAAEVDFSQ